MYFPVTDFKISTIESRTIRIECSMSAVDDQLSRFRLTHNPNPCSPSALQPCRTFLLRLPDVSVPRNGIFDHIFRNLHDNTIHRHSIYLRTIYKERVCTASATKEVALGIAVDATHYDDCDKYTDNHIQPLICRLFFLVIYGFSLYHIILRLRCLARYRASTTRTCRGPVRNLMSTFLTFD